MEIKETTIKRYNLYRVAKNFLKFSESFRQIRPRDKRCFICGSKFKDDDNIHLGFFKENKNRILCDDCLADIVINHPEVEVVDVKKDRKEKNEES